MFIPLGAELVNDNLAEYFAPTAAPQEKRLILQKIVESVHEQHGRFMKRDGGTGVWVPISKEEAALKTAMALQYRARKQSSPTSLQTCATVPPPPPPHALQVAPTPPPHHHSQSAPARPFDIYAPPPHVPHVSPTVHLQRPTTVLVPQPIRISSMAGHLPGSFTLERYRYLQELLYHQANQHCLAQRHAASIRAQLVSSAGFESSLRDAYHQAAAVYSSEVKCNDSDWVRRVQSTDPSFHENAAWQRTSIASSPRSISESFWEPLPLLRDNHGATEQDPDDLLSELSDSAFNASFEDVDESLDLSQLLDLDW
jgi:hypothetical protein